MESRSIPAAPYFDGQALRVELTALYNAHGSADKARQSVIERLKALVQSARQSAEAQLLLDGQGRRCAAGLSHFQDELIRLVYDYTTVHVYRAINPSAAEHMAIVATGGYGRGLLAPGSRHRSAVPVAVEADALGRERRRAHALRAVGSGLQGRPRHAHRRPVRQARRGGSDDPHRPARFPPHPRRHRALR